MANVMDQFEITPIVPLTVWGHDLSITNSTVFMAITTLAIIGFFHFALRKLETIPSRTQVVAEMLYGAIAATVKSTIGDAGRKYLPLILSLFLFILFANLFGLLPGSFTVTSHIIVTFFAATTIFVMVTIIGFAKHGTRFLQTFLPRGVPLILAPLIIIIELVSYLSRPISLSVRLFANVVVGHVLLKVFAGFVVALGIAGIAPLIGMVAIFALEFLVAVLQAYVFTILTCIYLNDALNLH